MSFCSCVRLGNGSKTKTQDWQTQESRKRLLISRTGPPGFIRQREYVPHTCFVTSLIHWPCIVTCCFYQGTRTNTAAGSGRREQIWVNSKVPSSPSDKHRKTLTGVTHILPHVDTLLFHDMTWLTLLSAPSSRSVNALRSRVASRPASESSFLSHRDVALILFLIFLQVLLNFLFK